MNYIQEANTLAKKVLSPQCLRLFKEARILGLKRDRKLVFFFKNYAGLVFFEKDKEKLLKRLRSEYKKNQTLYKECDFIFYEIKAMNSFEMKLRSEEEEAILERGIARLKNLLASNKKGKDYAISA